MLSRGKTLSQTLSETLSEWPFLDEVGDKVRETVFWGQTLVRACPKTTGSNHSSSRTVVFGHFRQSVRQCWRQRNAIVPGHREALAIASCSIKGMNGRGLVGLLHRSGPGRFQMSTFLGPCLICVAIALAEPLDNWHWRNPTVTGNRLHGIGASPSRFVAVGEFGNIIVSHNGSDWWPADSSTWITMRAVAWGNGLWVAVGDVGEILTSPDGLTWTPRPTPWFFDLMAVTWGGEQFVAVGENTSILTSPDGVQWTLRASGTHPLLAVTWGNGVFVAAGGEPPRIEPVGGGFGRRVSGQPLVLVSGDGSTWNRTQAPVAGQISCLVFGAGSFVAGTTSMETMISTNGVDWVPGYEPGGRFSGLGPDVSIWSGGGVTIDGRPILVE
jgi:hypothetical protein